jgi:hypothetical protein
VKQFISALRINWDQKGSGNKLMTNSLAKDGKLADNLLIMAFGLVAVLLRQRTADCMGDAHDGNVRLVMQKRDLRIYEVEKTTLNLSPAASKPAAS